MGQYKILNNFADEFSSSLSYSVGDLVMYLGTLYKCTTAHSPAAFDSTHFTQVNLKTAGTKTEVNPSNIPSSAPEVHGLVIDGDKYQSPKQASGDGVTFSLSTQTGFTMVNSFSSYNRMGKVAIFVCSFDIRKDAASSTPITIGTYGSIPNDIYGKLVGGSFLVEETTKAYVDGTFTMVDTPSSLIKGSNNTLSLELDPTNLVVDTTYHVRHMSIFLLSDNIDVDAPNPVLDNNSWAVIKRVIRDGEASNYWSVGDVKNDTGTDGVTRSFRIVDLNHPDYGVVFEEVALENGALWNAVANTDDNDCYNNYSISNMRLTALPTTLLKFSNDLQAVIITDTTYKVAKNGQQTTILTLTDKLFLEAEKEIWASRAYSRTEEWDALTTFSYWTTHTSNADHIKYDSGNVARSCWLRSPRSGGPNYVVLIYTAGSATYDIAGGSLRFSPCFSLAPISSTLNSNAWDVIKEVALSGKTSSYWSVGDTKTDTGTDGVTRTFRIVNIESDGSIVFEEVNLEDTNVKWDTNGSNNYYQSTIRNTHLSATLLKFSELLQKSIATSNIKVAENGESTTILTLTDKLFLEAAKELWASPQYNVSEENSELTTFSYWTTHTTNADHIKKDSINNARQWWTRSPASNNASKVIRLNDNGAEGYDSSNGTLYFSPCFRIGSNQSGGLGPYIPVSSTLNDNSWETIASVCKAGNASNYWSVGDTKTDVGTDGYTRTFRIADMSSLYGKHVVFEQVTLDGSNGSGATGVQWNTTQNNDYSTSTMRTTRLPDVITRYSTALQNEIENTSYQVCKGGTDGTLLTLTDKLFLAGAKEYGLTSYSRTEENNALTTFQYYQTHNTATDRIKYQNGDLTSGGSYWTRSPRSGNTYGVVIVNSSGNDGGSNTDSVSKLAPVFAW